MLFRVRLTSFFAGFLMVGVLAYANPGKTATLILNNPTEPPYTNNDHTGLLDRVIGTAFQRVGLTLKLIKLPPERGLINANTGLQDGDLNRIAGLEKIYPNLIKIPEKNMDMHFVGFTRHKKIVGGDWNNVKTYRLGYIKGWKIFETNLHDAKHLTRTKNAKQLMNLLVMDRIDIAFYSRWMGLAQIQELGLEDIELIEPPFAVREMFIYLHKKHANLVPKISAALQQLKKEGFYDRVLRETLTSLQSHSQ